jgi:catalase
VHARGAAAHGVFESYGTAASFTKASFLGRKRKKAEGFCRFSTVLGWRGSADTVRDTRGFAVKFYTDEGNFDLVGNNIPVFFIQDGIKFPDVNPVVEQAAQLRVWPAVTEVPETPCARATPALSGCRPRAL